MYIQSQKEFKQVTSALRKELKALYPASAPSHAQCLELLAKALGASGYAELLPKLPAERAAPKALTVSRFPLRNLHGLLDLVEPGEAGASHLPLWQTQGGDVISEDRCILVPEGFDPEDEDAGFDLPNRELLLDAYLELAQEQGLTKSLYNQVVEQKLDGELLQGLAQTIGFSLHHGELVSLEGMLRARL